MTAALLWVWGMTYESGYLPSLRILDTGARPSNRLASKSIVNALADHIITGRFRNGQEAKILITEDGSDFKVVAMGQQESEN